MPLYESVHQMEPMTPARLPPGLTELSAKVIQRSFELQGKLHPTTRATLRELLRAMNSYYSNRIEGQSTHPANIERALRNEYSDRPDVARLQRLAVAHLEAEQELELMEGGQLTAAFARDAHRAIYERLRADDRQSDHGAIEPGALRTHEVQVGRHVAPAASAVSAFLARYEQAYAAAAGWDARLLAIAAAHHRLAWIHPFEDGNGRAARLVSHAALFPLGAGLWSTSRGFARKREDYYRALGAADSPRRGDLDGRGNLSEQGLVEWCQHFLEVCLDQVTFMSKLLDLDGLKERLAAYVAFSASTKAPLRPQVALPLHHLAAAGPVTRGEFKQLTGLGQRVAQSELSTLLSLGLLVSDGPKSPVRLGLPLECLRFLLPGLYPEADAIA